MSNERFEELVNLYLDAEIGRRELDELKRVVKENALRRQQFEKACQLHQAARKALVGAAHGGSGERSGADTRHTAPRSLPPAAPAQRGGGRPHVRSSRHAQKRAQVNASVEAKLERQEAQGAAATLKLTEIGREGGGRDTGHGVTKRKRETGGGNPAVWFLAITGIVGALVLSMNMVNPETEGYSNMSDSSAIAPSISSVIVPEGMRGFTPDGDIELMHIENTYRARILINTVAGDSVSREFQIGVLARQAGGAPVGSIWDLEPGAAPGRSPAASPMDNPSAGTPAALQKLPPTEEPAPDGQ